MDYLYTGIGEECLDLFGDPGGGTPAAAEGIHSDLAIGANICLLIDDDGKIVLAIAGNGVIQTLVCSCINTVLIDAAEGLNLEELEAIEFSYGHEQNDGTKAMFIDDITLIK